MFGANFKFVKPVLSHRTRVFEQIIEDRESSNRLSVSLGFTRLGFPSLVEVEKRQLLCEVKYHLEKAEARFTTATNLPPGDIEMCLREAKSHQTVAEEILNEHVKKW
jgi:hypothetical protein